MSARAARRSEQERGEHERTSSEVCDQTASVSRMGAVTIRRGLPHDVPAIVALCGRALGWKPAEPNETLFRWKHLANPFGESPMWLAHAGDQLVGFRAMMRWQFRTPGGQIVRAARAVDTATDPAFQGQGIFRRLTMQAVEELTAEGVGFVFNTPNSQSRPGYLKMGWTLAGRVPIVARPIGLRGVLRMRGARAAAGKWSEPLVIGLDISDIDSTLDIVASEPTASCAPGSICSGTLTDRIPGFLAWRYGLPELHYRVIPTGDRRGGAVIRVRKRGSAHEVALVDVFGTDDVDRRAAVSTAIAAVADASAGDYLLAARGTPGTARFVPVPRQGPQLTLPRSGP